MKKLVDIIGKTSFIALCIFLFIAVFSDFIANDKCVICFKGEPGLFVEVEKCERGIRAPIPYRYNTIDKSNRNKSPFSDQEVSSPRYRHWLGTDIIGRDVLAGLINGCQIALWIGICSSLLSMIIGIILGYLGGYIGDDTIRIALWKLVLSFILISLGAWYLIYGSGFIKYAPSILLGLLVLLINKLFKTKPETYKVYFPMDILIQRAAEIFRSIPYIFIILVLLGVVEKRSYWNIIWIIALVRWPTIYRYLRAEILKLRNQNFVKSSKMLGLSDHKIFIEQVLPLAMSPVMISTAFGFAIVILLESTLSFLGIGVPTDAVSWGSILNQARSSFSSWWLALFPGIMIYLTILLFNTIGDKLSERIRQI